jgi:hypothetical protein
MERKPYLTLAGAIFAMVSLAHLLRAVMGWPVIIAGWAVPMWLSWAAFVGAGVLGVFGLTLSRRR